MVRHEFVIIAFLIMTSSVLTALGTSTFEPAFAATVNIDIVPRSSTKTTDAYSPNPIEVNVGDIVVWTNKDAQLHTVTSGTDSTADGKFGGTLENPASELILPNGSYEYTFTEAGEYPYFCSLHPSMVGTIAVQASAPSPAIDSLTTDKSSYRVGNSVLLSGRVSGVDSTGYLTMTAFNADGVVFKVDQFQPSSDGRFSYTLVLSGANATPGQWSVSVGYGNAKRSAAFSVEDTITALPIVVKGVQVTKADGAQVSEVKAGTQALVGIALENIRPSPQQSTVILQIESEDGSTDHLSWQSFTLMASQSTDVSFGWTPVSGGLHKVKVFVWQEIRNPVPLAVPGTLNITVNDSASTEIGLPGYYQTLITVAENKIVADIADTPQKKSLGLSVRSSMTEEEGMLFPFESEARHGFWMNGMKFPIDIIWLDADKRVVHIEPDLKPCSSVLDCPNYEPDSNALYVLETVAGYAAKYNITEGTQFNFHLV